jgi:cysteinyl-tRNA synthetase
MDDDFGTPGALALAFELAKELIREHNLLTHQGHTHLQPHLLRQKGAALLEILATLGFCWPQPATAQGSEKGCRQRENWPSFHPLKTPGLKSWWPNARRPARRKNFAEADRIREQFKASGDHPYRPKRRHHPLAAAVGRLGLRIAHHAGIPELETAFR